MNKVIKASVAEEVVKKLTSGEEPKKERSVKERREAMFGKDKSDEI